jgi:small basic protein (TIGR04137 family)
MNYSSGFTVAGGPCRREPIPFATAEVRQGADAGRILRIDGSLRMSLDKSLKKGGGLARARNVLTRAERLALLQEDDRWSPAAGVFNLPKTKYRRLAPGQSGPKRPEASSK